MDNVIAWTPTTPLSTPSKAASRPKRRPTARKHAIATRDDGFGAVSSPIKDTNDIGHEFFHKTSITRSLVNGRLRELDRTGKACRKWEETRLQVTSPLGVETWSYRAYRPLSDRAFRKPKNQGEPGSGNVVYASLDRFMDVPGLGHEEEGLDPGKIIDEGKVDLKETAYDKGVDPANTEGKMRSDLVEGENVEGVN